MPPPPGRWHPPVPPRPARPLPRPSCQSGTCSSSVLFLVVERGDTTAPTIRAGIGGSLLAVGSRTERGGPSARGLDRLGGGTGRPAQLRRRIEQVPSVSTRLGEAGAAPWARRWRELGRPAATASASEVEEPLLELDR